MIKLLKKYRVVALLVAHACVFALLYYLAFWLRFDFELSGERVAKFRDSVLVVVAIKTSVFLLLRNFHGWWRYVTFKDFVNLLRAAFVSLGFVYAFDQFLLASFQIPRTVVAIDCLLSVLFLGALRSLWRFWDEIIMSRASGKKLKRVFLIGNDYETAKFAHAINANRSWNMRVVGLVAQDLKYKYTIGQMPVVGILQDLPKLAREFHVRLVVANTETLSVKRLRQLMDDGRDEDYTIRVISKMSDQLLGQNQLPVREVQVEDLLRRPPTELDQSAIAALVRGKRVLVTGAGGSIGSELCRQLAKFGPAQLIILGRGENRIFHIERELREKFPELAVSPRIASVTDHRRMERLFDDFCPDLVYHAAAHKHLPLTELNVGEAILNNVLGTKIVADLSVAHGVEEFVLVSSDKAVNPTSVMGCTKQIGERYCLALGNQSEGTKFVVTRFGNVLGSSGSVIPVFQKQIRDGGPITVTDARMTRFFMTIPEAAQLVVQSSAMGQGGEIFVLDMGEQINIVDMARDMIRLAGASTDDIDIVFTGIRPGEKLYEELYYNEEEALETEHQKILTAYHRTFDYEDTEAIVHELIAAAYGPDSELRILLKRCVPEYQFDFSGAAEPGAVASQ